jgi:hypothetical protein
MKGPQEYRKIINRIRSRRSRYMRKKGRHPNGGTGWLDHPRLERLLYNSKRVIESDKKLDL